MRALITGITGFAGSHLADHLLSLGDADVSGISWPPGARLPGATLYEIDLNDGPAVRGVMEAVRPDAIYHLAAQAAVPRAWEDPTGTLTNNLGAQVNLLQAVIALGLDPAMLIVGSADEYGRVSAEDLPIDEDTPLRPLNPYAVSKVAQDYLGLQYHLSHGLRIVRVRPFNHIGPRQRPGFVVPDFCQQIARIEAGLQPPILRVGDLTAQRDFTDVRDMVRGYHAVLTCGKAGEVYNLGASRAYAIREVLDQLLALSAATIAVEPDPQRMRPSDTPVFVSDCRRALRDTGWEPRIPLANSLRDALDDWRRQVTLTAGA